VDHPHLRRLGVDDRVREPVGEQLWQVRAQFVHARRLGAEHGLPLVGVGGGGLRHDPLRGALEPRKVRDAPDDSGRDLHRCRVGADDADARAVDRDADQLSTESPLDRGETCSASRDRPAANTEP
jgi:hypothetical protein